jgi:hypothetical protein
MKWGSEFDFAGETFEEGVPADSSKSGIRVSDAGTVTRIPNFWIPILSHIHLASAWSMAAAVWHWFNFSSVKLDRADRAHPGYFRLTKTMLAKLGIDYRNTKARGLRALAAAGLIDLKMSKRHAALIRVIDEKEFKQHRH